jgi:uncharacterized protein (TIGR03086 family)
MTTDALDLFGRASEWTLSKVVGAGSDLGASTPCDEWDVRALMNHMLDTEQYFLGQARGQDVPRPSPNPPQLLGEDPVADFTRVRDDMLSTFGADGVIEQTGPSLGIAFCDQLLHGWDLARATGQDATMPEGLPAAAYEMVHGMLGAGQRGGAFKPEVPVPANASPQERLLGFVGRNPG